MSNTCIILLQCLSVVTHLSSMLCIHPRTNLPNTRSDHAQYAQARAMHPRAEIG